MKLNEYVKRQNYNLESRGLEALWASKFQEGGEEYEDPKTLDLPLSDWVEQEECYLEVYPEHFKAFVKKASPVVPDSPWLPISEAPKDGTVVDLWLKEPWDKRQADMVWYEPWGVWMHKDAPETIGPDTDTFGTGALVPTHFMYPPKGPNS